MGMGRNGNRLHGNGRECECKKPFPGISSRRPAGAVYIYTTFIKWTGWTLAIVVTWWQDYDGPKRCRFYYCYLLYYYTLGHSTYVGPVSSPISQWCVIFCAVCVYGRFRSLEWLTRLDKLRPRHSFISATHRQPSAHEHFSLSARIRLIVAIVAGDRRHTMQLRHR